MKTKIFLGAVISLIIFVILKANPIVEMFLSEIKMDNDNFQIEIQQNFVSLDGFSLTSNSDTAYIKNGLVPNEWGYFIIDKDSLTDDFNFSRLGDTIKLREPSGSVADFVSYGYNSLNPAPADGQSLCAARDADMNIFWYLDNSPTIGMPNDTINATGVVQGVITNLIGRPVPNAKVIYELNNYLGGFPDSLYAVSDSAGRFSFSYIARYSGITAAKADYLNKVTSFLIYPESLTNLDTLKLEYNNAFDFYPLSVGNLWYYLRREIRLGKVTERIVEREIAGIETQINGRSYFHITEFDPEVDYIIHEYDRFDSTLGYAYRFRNEPQNPNDEFVYQDFSVSPGEISASELYQFSDSSSGFVCSGAEPDSLFGLSRIVKSYRYGFNGSEYEFKFADGIGEIYFGLVQSGGSSYGDSLIGCRVNGIFYGDSILTSVEFEDNQRSDKFYLYPNFPNPFNPATTIRFYLPTAGRVQLKVYDALGGQIAELINGDMNAGLHYVEFNAEIDGTVLSSGIYFYGITFHSYKSDASDYSSARKMLLLK